MTTAASFYPPNPPYGTTVFTGMEAAASGHLVHFVGRRRGEAAGQLPLGAANLATPARLANILIGGLLRAFPVPGSGASRVICASDISAAELVTAFACGLNTRGALEPWALVLDREAMWALGMRPVVYADLDMELVHKRALVSAKGPGWDGLVVRTEIRPGPSRTDWTHEREWRMCFDGEAEIASTPIERAVRAVIVGQSQWTPARPVEAMPEVALTYSPNFQAVRWFWNGETLTHDGCIQVTTSPPG
jgi:hypothetical protein